MRRTLTPAEIRRAPLLRGVTRRHGRWWVAECLEVAVVAQGATREEARANLGEALRAYAADAEALEAEGRRVALIGPVPWYGLRVLSWYAHRLLSRAPVYDI